MKLTIASRRSTRSRRRQQKCLCSHGQAGICQICCSWSSFRALGRAAPLRRCRSSRAPGLTLLRLAARLRPEFVPGVEVAKVLPAVSYPAILKLEDDAAVNFKVLAVSLSAVVMNGDDAAVTISSQVQQLGPESPFGLRSQLAEVGKRGVSAFVVASQRAAPRRVPRRALLEQLDERVHVAGVEGLVTAPHDGDVFGCAHRFSFALPLVNAATLRRARFPLQRITHHAYAPSGPRIDKRTTEIGLGFV